MPKKRNPAVEGGADILSDDTGKIITSAQSGKRGVGLPRFPSDPAPGNGQYFWSRVSCALSTGRAGKDGFTTLSGVRGRDAIDNCFVPGVREAWRKEVERLCRKHGPRAFEFPRKAAAVHEAGHAVVYADAGLQVTSVSVSLQRVGTFRAWTGYTKTTSEPSAIGPNSSAASDALQIRFYLAGRVAEKCFLGSDFREGSALDEMIVGQIIAQAIDAKTGGDAKQIFDANWMEVADVLRKNKNSIGAIARKLMHRRKLTGAQLTPLLADVTLSGVEGVA